MLLTPHVTKNAKAVLPKQNKSARKPGAFYLLVDTRGRIAKTSMSEYSKAKPHIMLGMPAVVLGAKVFTIKVGTIKLM